MLCIPQHHSGSASPSPIPAWHFVLYQVQLCPVPEPAPGHTPPCCGTHPVSLCGSTVALWSRNRSASRSAGTKVIWGKERQSPGLCWAAQGPWPSEWGEGQSVPSAGHRVFSHHIWMFSWERALLRAISKE